MPIKTIFFIINILLVNSLINGQSIRISEWLLEKTMGHQFLLVFLNPGLGFY